MNNPFTLSFGKVFIVYFMNFPDYVKKRGNQGKENQGRNRRNISLVGEFILC